MAKQTGTATKPTERQQKVLDGLKKNKSPKQIAKAMKISTNGVYVHMRRMRELGIELPGTPSPNGRSQNSKRTPRSGPRRAAQKRRGPTDGKLPSAAEVIERVAGGIGPIIAQYDDEIHDAVSDASNAEAEAKAARKKAEALRGERDKLNTATKALK